MFWLVNLYSLFVQLCIVFRVKYPLFLSDFNGVRIFWTYFRKVLKYEILMKIHPVAVKLFHADWQKWQSKCSIFSQVCERAYKATETPVKFVTLRIISSTHRGVVRLWKSAENGKCFASSFGCLKQLFGQDEQNTDHETELVGNDGNYSGLCFECDRFECQPKHGLFWKFFNLLPGHIGW